VSNRVVFLPRRFLPEPAATLCAAGKGKCSLSCVGSVTEGDASGWYCIMPEEGRFHGQGVWVEGNRQSWRRMLDFIPWSERSNVIDIRVAARTRAHQAVFKVGSRANALERVRDDMSGLHPRFSLTQPPVSATQTLTSP